MTRVICKDEALFCSLKCLPFLLHIHCFCSFSPSFLLPHFVSSLLSMVMPSPLLTSPTYVCLSFNHFSLSHISSFPLFCVLSTLIPSPPSFPASCPPSSLIPPFVHTSLLLFLHFSLIPASSPSSVLSLPYHFLLTLPPHYPHLVCSRFSSFPSPLLSVSRFSFLSLLLPLPFPSLQQPKAFFLVPFPSAV